ncbi:MAG: hypothetical protein ACHBN1_32905 [Heteroscytonema crispum UTEX LB 1556]
MKQKSSSSPKVYQGSGSITTLDIPQNNLDSQILLLQEKINEIELDESLKKRLEGFLKNVKSISATDKLRNLIDKGLLDKKLVQAWKDIRNGAAHGYVLENHKLEKYKLLLNEVTVLFHHLIFLMIDYTGKYTDYTKVGWKKEEFNQRITTSASSLGIAKRNPTQSFKIDDNI